MESIFLEKLVQFCMYNFSFEPSNGKHIPIYMKKSFNLDALNFPGKEKLSNLFFYESLSLLLKMQKLSIEKKRIENFLEIIYAFYSGNKNIISALDILGYNIPYKNSENIKKCFCENDDFISFLVFNLILLFYKNIPQKFCESYNFHLLEIVILYDYIYICGSIKKKELKFEVIKVIKEIFNIYTSLSEIKSIFSNLKIFLFESGNVKVNDFLIPENIYEQGLNDFNVLIDSINKIIKFGLNLPNFVDIFKYLNFFKRKKLNMSEKNKEAGNSIENSINVEKKISNIQEELSKIEQKFNNRFNLQNNLIDEQKIIIDTNNRKVKELNDKIKLLNDNILYKDIAFEKNEEEIKKLKKIYLIKIKN